MLETGSALLIVVGAIFALRHVAIRMGLGTAGGATRTLFVRETCALSSKQRICIVEAEGRRFLVGATDAGVQLLDRLPDPDAPAREPDPPPEKTPPPAPRRWLRIGTLALGGLGLGLLDPSLAVAAEGDPSISIGLGGVTAPEEISSALEIVALLTVVSIAPSIVLMATCFTRIVIVLAFLRQAIGIQQLPPSQVLVGLSLFITLFVMAPVGEEIRANAYTPYVAKEIDVETAAARAMVPVRRFLTTHTREDDLGLFLELAGHGPVATVDDIPITSLLPAYMLSELRTAFEIGFMIYLPFLVVDLIIASMLISMGMIVLPPIVISLPFKLMLFVLMDGWNRVVGALVDGLI